MWCLLVLAIGTQGCLAKFQLLVYRMPRPAVPRLQWEDHHLVISWEFLVFVFCFFFWVLFYLFPTRRLDIFFIYCATVRLLYPFSLLCQSVCPFILRTFNTNENEKVKTTCPLMMVTVKKMIILVVSFLHIVFLQVMHVFVIQEKLFSYPQVRDCSAPSDFIIRDETAMAQSLYVDQKRDKIAWAGSRL